jgi:hypothetical protein
VISRLAQGAPRGAGSRPVRHFGGRGARSGT